MCVHYFCAGDDCGTLSAANRRPIKLYSLCRAAPRNGAGSQADRRAWPHPAAAAAACFYKLLYTEYGEHAWLVKGERVSDFLIDSGM
jgi:hypothetical protein